MYMIDKYFLINEIIVKNNLKLNIINLLNVINEVLFFLIVKIIRLSIILK